MTEFLCTTYMCYWAGLPLFSECIYLYLIYMSNQAKLNQSYWIWCRLPTAQGLPNICAGWTCCCGNGWFWFCNSLRLSDAYMRQYNMPKLLEIMACHLFWAKPLSEPMLPYCQLDPKEHISVKFCLKFESFHSSKCTWKCCLGNGGHFVSSSMC